MAFSVQVKKDNQTETISGKRVKPDITISRFKKLVAFEFEFDDDFRFNLLLNGQTLKNELTLGSYKLDGANKNAVLTIETTKPGDAKVIIPTQPEAHGLATLEMNIDESNTYIKEYIQSKTDLETKTRNSKNEITNTFNELTKAIKKRKEELIGNVTKLYQERMDIIKKNQTELRKHKESGESALKNLKNKILEEKNSENRENHVVKECERIIGSTPKLKYILTELKFNGLDKDDLINSITQFGLIEKKGIEEGDRLVFKSQSVIVNMPASGPKNVTMPKLMITKFAIDSKGKYKITIKIDYTDATFSEDDSQLEYLYLHVECSQQQNNPGDDDVKNDDIKTAPVYTKEIKLQSLIYISKSKKYVFDVDYSFTGGWYVSCKARLLFKPDTELKKKYNPGNSQFTNYKPIQARSLKKYKLEFNADEKEVGVPDAFKKSALKFEEYFLKVFNITLNDGETLELTIMDDAEVEEAFNINAFNSEDDLIFIGKIKKKKIKRMKSPQNIPIKHASNNNSYNSDATNNAEYNNDSKQNNNNNNSDNDAGNGLLFQDYADGEGGHMSENEIAEAAPVPAREYPKKIKFKVINREQEKRLFLLKKKDNNGVINWESVRKLILSKDDFREEVFTGLTSKELGNICNDDDVWNKLCVNTIKDKKFIPVVQLYHIQ